MNTPAPHPGRPLRILLVGDASRCHLSLAEGLRAMGHSVTVASHGSRWMATGRDIDISRPALPGPLGGLALWLKVLWLRRRMRGYDVVSVLSSSFLDLKPGRQRSLWRWLRRHNRLMTLTLLGSDSLYVETLSGDTPPLPYSEYRVGRRPGPASDPAELRAWAAEPLAGLCREMYADCDGALSVLWEYHLCAARHLPPARLDYIGIPIDTASLPLLPIPREPGPVCIFLGRHSRRTAVKGTDVLLEGARLAESRLPGLCRVELVEDVPYADYLTRLAQAHIVLDQLYSHTPATNALLAMAMGKVVVSGAEPGYYEFIGDEAGCEALVNADPAAGAEGVARLLEELVRQGRPALRERGLAGRSFVERHNGRDVVARRALRFWQSLMHS